LNDLGFLKLAVKLGSKGLGYTEPNPMVGAVVVKNGRILSTGYHKKYGEVHAERMALEKTDEENTTLFVSLEPCSHQGKTPPCTDIIIQKKVKRVVIASIDPNPIVAGKGIEKLKSNGIEVSLGGFDKLNREINSHYFTSIEKKRPFICLKAGVSIDGKLTDKEKNSKWITNEELRDISNEFRKEFSAILVGINTVLSDNPNLTIKDKNFNNKKLIRVVLDSENRLSKDKYQNFNIFKNQEFYPTYIFSSKNAKNIKLNKSADKHFFISDTSKGLDLKEILNILHKDGIFSILIEGGGKIHESFLREKLFDEIVLFTDKKIIGGKDSIEFFAKGTKLSEPINFSSSDIIELENGYIFRGKK